MFPLTTKVVGIHTPNISMKKFAIISFISALLFGISVNAAAPSAPDLEKDKDYSLTINFVQDKDNGESQKISGGEFTAYRIADLSVSGGGVYYTCVDPYKGIAKFDDDGKEITFDGISSDISHEYAMECAKQKGTAIASAVSSESGASYLAIKDPGMYLVMETGRSGKAAQYETVDPFLVSVPALSIEPDSVVKWVYDVNTYPKTAVKRIPEKEEPKKDEEPAVQQVKENKARQVKQTSQKSENSQTATSAAQPVQEKHTNQRTGDADHILIYSAISVACFITLMIARKTKKS